MNVPITGAQLLSALNWRYATKKFDPTRKIPAETWSVLEQALVLSPSSFGLQPWKFFVITEPTLRASLVPHSWGQTQAVDCSHLVVFAVKKNLGAAHVDKYFERVSAVTGAPTTAFAGYRKMIDGSLAGATKSGTLDNWQTHQIYIALGQFMASAALLGVDTCPMEGFEPAKYDAALGLTGTEWATVVACPAGYRAADDKYAAGPKVRFEAKDVIVHI